MPKRCVCSRSSNLRSKSTTPPNAKQAPAAKQIGPPAVPLRRVVSMGRLLVIKYYFMM